MTEIASALSDAPDDVNSDVESASTTVAAAGPSRSDSPVSEVTERFFKAIVAIVPLDRIEELHLFAPLRQGGVETGIAVVAARVPTPVVVATPEQQPEQVSDELLLDGEESEDIDAKDDVLASEASDDEPVADDDAALVPATIERHTVYTARYRLVVKGPERGRWESDVVAEADAPLLTVETVVRGVQRRAGEDTAILLYSDRQIARALRLPWPPDAAPATAAVADQVE